MGAITRSLRLTSIWQTKALRWVSSWEVVNLDARSASATLVPASHDRAGPGGPARQAPAL